MRINSASLLLLLVVGIFTAALRAEAVVLRYDLKKGDTFRYRELSSAVLKMSSDRALGKIPLPNYQFTTDSIVRDSVTEVTSKGLIIITRQVESGTVTTTTIINGRQQKKTTPQPKIKTLIKMTSDGTVLSVRSIPPDDAKSPDPASLPNPRSMPDQLLQTAELEAAISRPPLSRNDLSPNDTWSNLISVPGLFNGTAQNMTIKSRLLAVEPYKGTDCAKLRTSISLPIDSDLSDIIGGLQLPQGSTGRLSLQGKVTGLKDWQFDYKKSAEVYAEGKLTIVAATSFQIIGSDGKLVRGDYKINMKANTKSVLLEGK